MLTIARRARSMGLSQEYLANLLRSRGHSVTAGNVYRHFESKKPHAATVEMYCDVLGLKPLAARAAVEAYLGREALTTRDLTRARSEIRVALARIESASESELHSFDRQLHGLGKAGSRRLFCAWLVRCYFHGGGGVAEFLRKDVLEAFSLRAGSLRDTKAEDDFNSLVEALKDLPSRKAPLPGAVGYAESIVRHFADIGEISEARANALLGAIQHNPYTRYNAGVQEAADNLFPTPETGEKE